MKRASLKGGISSIFEPTQPVKAAAKPAEAEEAQYDQRATFYFSEEQLMNLEVAMLKVRTEHRLKVGKSEIMRLAIDHLLQDFEQNKETSILVRHFANQR